MGAPTIYRWDDTDAPVGSGKRGSLINVLKKCLVEGYSSKAAAGWTMPFVDADGYQAGFRNNPTTGTGFFLHVDNNNVGAQTEKALLQGYETMSDYQTGLGPFSAANKHSAWLSWARDSTPRPWVIIADDRCFYLFSWFNKTTNTVLDADFNSAPIFFGDFIVNDQNDTYGCTLHGQLSTNRYPHGFYYAAPVSSAGVYWMTPRKSDGVNTPVLNNLNSGGGPGGDIPGANGPDYVSGGMILLSRPYLNDTDAYSFRGFVPGLHFPCHENHPFNNFQQIDIDGSMMMVIHTREYAIEATILIDISENFRP
jgi:hypothetical protein